MLKSRAEGGFTSQNNATLEPDRLGGMILASRKICCGSSHCDPSNRVTVPTPPRDGSRAMFGFSASTGVTKPMPTSDMSCAGAAGAEEGMSIALPL